MLQEIWSELIGVERIGIRDDFFKLGGHSMLAARVVSRIRELIGVDVPLGAFFDNPSVAALGQMIETAQRDNEQTEPPFVVTSKQRGAS